MSNQFVKILDARIKARASSMSDNNTNNKRMKRLSSLLGRKDIADFLIQLECDAKMLNKNIYALFKIEDMLDIVFNKASDMQKMHSCVTRTIIQHAKNNVDTITTNETHAAISRDIKISAKQAHLIFQNDEIKSEKTVDTQSSSSCNALQFFKIIEQIASKNKNFTYKINLENVMLQKMIEHYT